MDSGLCKRLHKWLTLGKAQGKDADTDARNVTDSVGTSLKGSSCGTNVVNQQHMLAFQQSTFLQQKHIRDVLLTLVTAQQRLTLTKVLAA